MTRTTMTAAWRRLQTTDPLLTWTGVGMLAVLALTLVGLRLDPREIAGTPAWLKPAKFAASTAIYSFTLAWFLGYLTDRPRLRRRASRITAAVFVLEVAIISLQAARGTTSHFNAATALDGLLFTVMGVGIVLQTIVMAVLVVALWRQRFDDAAFGWALRLGLLISVVGAFTGGLMTRPTADQVAEARETGRMTVAGAHTVGAPDGGPGLPVTGWSRDHGDLRVAHFVGLHAMQILPMAALLPVVRRRRAGEAARLVQVLGASYAGLFGLLLWQALRAQPLLAPDATTLIAAGIWIAVTLALVTGRRPVIRRARTSPSY